MFFVGFMPQSALVWLREKLSQRHGAVEAAAARRAGAADRARGHRPLRPHAARRGGHQQHRGAGPRRHRRPDEQHAHRRRRARRLDRPGHPLPPRRRRRRRPSAHAERAARRRRRPSGVEPAGRPPQPLPPPLVRHPHGDRPAAGVRPGDPSRRRRSRQASRPRSRRCATRPRAAEQAEHAPVSPIQTIIDTLPDEEWFMQIRNWRNPEFGAADAWYRYLDGDGTWTPRNGRRCPGGSSGPSSRSRAYPMATTEPAHLDHRPRRSSRRPQPPGSSDEVGHRAERNRHATRDHRPIRSAPRARR